MDEQMRRQQPHGRRAAIRRRRRRQRLARLVGLWVFFLFLMFVCVRHFLFPPDSPKAKTPESSVAEPGNRTTGKEIDMKEKNAIPASSLVKDPSNGTDINLLLLVNPAHRLPDDYEISITRLNGGQAIATVCFKDLQKMMDDCRAAGNKPLICSSYRSMEKQQALFENKVQRCRNEGLDEEEARKEAATVVAIPGTSEHQLGLALDIVDTDNQRLDDSQQNTATQRWLMANSYKYGFILRYPPKKKELTGIIYEPWHYRYVGREAAKYIYEHDLCLEEYLGLVNH